MANKTDFNIELYNEHEVQVCDLDEINILQVENNQEDHFNAELNEVMYTLTPDKVSSEYLNDPNNMSTVTKKGTIRKRKTYSTPLIERKKFKKEQIRIKHKLKPPCVTCKKQCFINIPENLRQTINDQYWGMTKQERKVYLLNTIKRHDVKRRRGTNLKQRNWSFSYYFSDKDGIKVNVCKHFFITTLGYTKANDRFILDVCSKQNDKSAIIPSPNEIHFTARNKIDQETIIKHINYFNPMVAHYRREHAPHRRYLPNEINASEMYNDFMEKHPEFKCSYDVYRKTMSMNVSFSKLGHEECELCEEFTQHKSTHTSDIDNCTVCKKWFNHKENYTAAREKYTDHGKRQFTNEIRVSVDLQKVIMLPRMDNFKAAIFTKRIICFNESFVPIGPRSDIKPLAIIWNEGVAGRKQEDLTSCFYQYFIFNKRIDNHIIWLDNCSAQNKNWCFLTFLIYIINSKDIDAKEINLYYFQPGHSFMSADSFHHQVELSMKKMGKIYDFFDFEKCIRNSNTGRVDV